MTLRPLLVLAAFVAMSCEQATVIESLSAGSFDVVTQVSPLELAASPAFADERGGGVFIDLAGQVVRMRPDGSRGVLEGHPRNVVFPGPASAVWALGASNALVATTRGLFVADQGWLIAPPWQASVPAEGLLDAVLADDGVAWLAHQQGLYRLDRGALYEFTLEGAALTGLTAVAAAPTLDGSPGVWFAREGKLFAASQGTDGNQFQVRSAGLTADSLAGGVLALAGIGPSKSSAGEVWAITKRGLLLYTGTSWREYAVPASPRRLLSAGRFAWLQAGDALYRYDADTRAWAEAKGLASAPTLLGVDAAGAAWVRVGEQTMALTPAPPTRVVGLHEGARVYDGQLVVQASLASDALPESLTWDLDGVTVHPVDLDGGVAGTGPTGGRTFFSLGGTEAGGVLKPLSFGALGDGWHTLTVAATTGETTTSRRLHFEFLGASTAQVSWAADIEPLNLERCAKCHSVNTSPELKTYEQWKANAADIAAAVRDTRMPADGTRLDAASTAAIIRWVNGGAQP